MESRKKKGRHLGSARQRIVRIGAGKYVPNVGLWVIVLETVRVRIGPGIAWNVDVKWRAKHNFLLLNCFDNGWGILEI